MSMTIGEASPGASPPPTFRADAVVDRVEASAYRIPTDAPEADGTAAWGDTTLVVVEVSAGGGTGLGYTYASSAAASVMRPRMRTLRTCSRQ